MNRKQIRKKFSPAHKFYQSGRYVSRAWVFSVSTKLERPSVENAKLRLHNLDSIRAPGYATKPLGLNAYIEADAKKLAKRAGSSALTGQAERVCQRQNFICPVCGQSLSNGEEIEIHHTPSLKELNANHIPSKQVKLVALHKLCHLYLHSKAS